ncbi:MAG TPA: glycosyltransferase family 4 protein [Verrucomicrobiae bacterium]|nr:glycosyltransferase family 4 protein [Verrucomicrobiae bacterium]
MPDTAVIEKPITVLQFNSLLNGGGTDDQCLKLTEGLRQLGQRVWVAGPDQHELSGRVRDLAVPFHSLPPTGPFRLRLILAAAKVVRRENVRILHGHHGRDFWPVIFAARLSGSHPKVVQTRHLAKSPSSWFTRRFLLGQCDAIIAVSQFVADVLSQGAYEPASPEPERRARPPLLGDHSKILVIHGGIDTNQFRPLDAQEQRQAWGLAPEHFAFGVVGGYDLPRGKGQREFLQAAARVHEKIADARFLIIGRGSMEAALKDDIVRLGLKEKAILTPYCRDMPRAMNAIDCLVHPQIGTEAFPGVVLEAYACGKPVIASRLDGIPEAFAAGALGELILPGSIEQLSEALLKWARETRLTAQRQQELHERIHMHFSVQVASQKTLALYRRLQDG